MSEESNTVKGAANRRSFLKKGLAAGTATVGAELLAGSSPLFARDVDDEDDDGGQLTGGDAAILRFLAAAEILESDLWEQYWELGGTQDNEFA
ncbi:MAG TPA: hypothetical protein VHZ55_32630, partial [Bryobacteraceae bacterium]|nr:hypothetical protein [Bryobacteraceae bacterium]